MIDIFLSILSGLTPIILVYVGYVSKVKFKKLEFNLETKKQKSEQENITLSDKITSIEKSVKDLRELLESYISDNAFRIKFKNTIRNKSRQLHSLYNNILSKSSRNAILKWAGLMEKFGLDFFYSEQRKLDEKKRNKYLTTILNSYIDDFYNYADISHPKTRILKNKQIIMSDLLKSSNIHSKTEYLKIRLIKNGLSSDDMIDLFDDYISEFSQDLSNVFQSWDTLQEV